jgi:hypothetical protein
MEAVIKTASPTLSTIDQKDELNTTVTGGKPITAILQYISQIKIKVTFSRPLLQEEENNKNSKKPHPRLASVK